MGHDHDHDHDHGRGAGRLALGGAFVITAAFLVVEVVGGYISGSLALLADAGHMLGDAAALGMSLWASSLALRPPDKEKSFGYRRAEVLAAFINALALLLIAGMILREIPERFDPEHEILTTPMMIVAALGLVANLVSGAILLRAARHSINARGAFLHVLADSLGSVAVLMAGAIIMLTGWTLADPVASLVIAALITWGAIRLLRETWHILMEGTPPGVDRESIKQAFMKLDGVLGVHSIHVWSITPGSHALTAHLVTRDGEDPDAVLRAARGILPEGLNVEHVTVQIEPCNGVEIPNCPLGCGARCQFDEEEDTHEHGKAR
ncbi:MAG: cation transporter [Deltaproteobacteria bacterium]|nr:cation transporter [Deltaproteobacteria bacterium]